MGVEGLDPLRDSRIVITGATGFVGTWLMATIAHLNDVHGFGMRITGVARRLSRLKSQAPALAGRADIELIEADVRQLPILPAETRWLIHAAGNPDRRHHATNPIDTASVIAEGTTRMLRLAEQAEQLQCFLHVSSGLVGRRCDRDSRLSASDVYAEAKTFSEALCAAFRTQSRIPIVTVRPFTFMGPFQSLDAPWAANNFLYSAIHGQPIKLLGTGETARAFLYGSDMAALVLHQLVRGASGDTYDLGGTEVMRLIDLAQTVVAQARRPIQIQLNTGGRDIQPDQLVPDMLPSQRRFGFRPAFSAADAVARTLAWNAQPAQVS